MNAPEHPPRPAGAAARVAADDRPPAGQAGRVAVVQAQARTTLMVAAGFALAAPVAAVLPHRTGRWLPLHLFLVGALLSAISGATQLFAVTWAAGPPPARGLVVAQRFLLAVGAIGLACGREAGFPAALQALSGLSVAAALVLLAVALERIVARAVQRRFDVTLRWYRAALAAGAVGVGLGVAMVTGAPTAGSAGRVRDAHLLLNLLGLVGLVMAGTLPFFVATQARMKMSPRARTGLEDRLRRLLIGALAAAVAALLAGRPAVAGGALVVFSAGQLGVAALLPRPGRRQLRWAGPRLVQLACGLAWWAGSVLAMGISLLQGGPALPDRVLLALTVGGYAQILAASLAYLGPVLRAGGHERLTAGFAVTASWYGLAAGNGAAAAFVAGRPFVAAAFVATWALDTAFRAARLFGRNGTGESAADRTDTANASLPVADRS